MVDLNKKFGDALVQGECDVVDAMLEEGYIPSRNCIDIPCNTGNVDMLTRLLPYHMDVQKGLFIAVQNKHVHLLDHLFLAGADINCIDNHNNTCLYYTSDLGTAKWLLDMGAKQILNDASHSRLFWACFNQGNFELVKLLLQYPGGAEMINKPDEDGETPLYWACHEGDSEVVRLLLQYHEGIQAINIQSKDGETPLHAACRNGSLEVIKLLLQYPGGIQTITFQCSQCNTPLHEACQNGKLEAVELLLQYPEGVKTITYQCSRGRTPLDRAVLYPEILSLLQSKLPQ